MLPDRLCWKITDVYQNGGIIVFRNQGKPGLRVIFRLIRQARNGAEVIIPEFLTRFEMQYTPFVLKCQVMKPFHNDRAPGLPVCLYLQVNFRGSHPLRHLRRFGQCLPYRFGGSVDCYTFCNGR